MDEEFDFRMGDTDLDWLEFRNAEERDWDESKHPRDPGGEGGGQFVGGGGGDGGGDTDEYGLGSRERQALADWMGSGYRDMRTDPNFGKVLEKLPQVTGLYFRGTRMTDQELATFKNGVGGTVPFTKHSSSSFRSDSAKSFMESQRHDPEKKIPVLFEVRGSGAKIPRQLASEAGSDEAEIVLPMGAEYEITEVKPSRDDDFGEYYVVKLSRV
jgi:hypothetical protein